MALRDQQRLYLERLFKVCFRQHQEERHFEIPPQDMVQRWHDETDHGRTSGHYQNALAVNIAICVPSLHLLAFHRPVLLLLMKRRTWLSHCFAL